MNSNCGVKESLFVCAQSNEPSSILTIDPVSGGNCLAFQGNELQSGTIHSATFIGQDQTHLCIALKDISIMTIPMKHKKSKKTLSTICTRSFLGQKANFIVSHPSGDFIFVASDNKIYSWELSSGNMLSMIEEHIREISAFKISTCGSLLASASMDGAVKIWLTARLITQSNEGSRISPQLAGHSSHTLEVNDLYITSSGMSARIFSVSADHNACLYSLATNQIILKITSDHPLSACCMDGAERRMFLASTDGQIRTIDLMKSELPKDSFQRMEVENKQKDGKTENSFQFHKCRVQQLCTNFDGSRLASGDSSGAFAIWDVTNGQLLQNGQMKGPIIVLTFILENQSAAGTSLPPLNRQMSSGPKSSFAVKHAHLKKVYSEKCLQDHFGKMLRKANTRALRCDLGSSNSSVEGTSKDNRQINISNQNKNKRKRCRVETETTLAPTENPPNEEENGESVDLSSNEATTNVEQLKQRIRILERELARVVQINAEIYDYAANLTIDEDNVVT
uniref:WD_REPEATS_REGION domain-containing protein n=1 Tax=Meloidogyne hapla TaxID=6305 RepID=A0A1I8C1J3_MELHA